MKLHKILLAAVLAGSLSVNFSLLTPVYAENSLVPADNQKTGEAAASFDYALLVNKEHKLPDDYESRVDLVKVKNCFGKDFEVERETYTHFQELQEDLKKDGIHIELESAYRSVARQKELTEELRQSEGEDYVKNFVAVPGYSEHHTGMALDVSVVENGRIRDDEYLHWETPYQKMHRKLADHGFILRYPPGKAAITGYAYESWHCRYVGKELAAKLFAQDVTLEEYLLADKKTADLRAARITPDYWTVRNPEGEKTVSAVELQQFQQSLRAKDMLLAEMKNYPPMVSREEVLAKIDYAMEDFTAAKPEGLYENHDHGMKADQTWQNTLLSPKRYDEVHANCGKDSLAMTIHPRYALALHRSNLRYLPTADSWYDDVHDAHYDLLQGNVLDPGEPVAVLAVSRDQKFCFVDTRNYAGWVDCRDLVFVDRAKWQQYTDPAAFLVVTADKKFMQTAEGEKLELQMGSRLPLSKPLLQADGTWLVTVPQLKDGKFAEEEIAVLADDSVHKGYLEFSRNNILRQSFRFFNDLYGWGGLEGGVDCSLLTADVYRSLGVDIPGDANRQLYFLPQICSLTAEMGQEERLQAVKKLHPGDLLFSPGHVMVYLGTDETGEPYLIQAGSSRYFPGEGDDGALKYYTRRVTVDDFYFYKKPAAKLLDCLTGAGGYLP